MVSFFDSVRENRNIKYEIDAAIAEVIASGQFINGPAVSQFENDLSSVVGARVIGVSSGTDALLMLLTSLGIGPGDMVIVPSFTFVASASCIVRLGAKPLFVDIDPDTYMANRESVEALCRSFGDRVKAVIVVNLFGDLADMPNVDVPVIEDSAQALGAGFVRGCAATYSFFPTKNLGGLGDGGAIAVRSRPCNYYELAKLRRHGLDKGDIQIVGGNYRLDTIQAAILSAKLKRLDYFIRARRANAAAYRESLKNVAGIKLPVDSRHHTYNQFVIRCEKRLRENLRRGLSNRGIETKVYYPFPIHCMAAFRRYEFAGDDFLPETVRACDEVLALPIYPDLPTSDREKVINAIRSVAA